MQDTSDSDYVEYVTAKLAWLRKVAFLLCQDWDRADDLAQATITRLYIHWRRARAADNLDGYVRTVLVRVFLSERRTRWARVALGDPPGDRAAPEDDATTRVAVRRALVTVPPRQRATLVLRYYCDLSVDDTAASLGCSVGTVKSQTAKGLAALRTALGDTTASMQRGIHHG